MAGGSGDLPWTVVFERRVAQRAHTDVAAFTAFGAAVRDVTAEARTLRRFARWTRAARVHPTAPPLPRELLTG